MPERQPADAGVITPSDDPSAEARLRRSAARGSWQASPGAEPVRTLGERRLEAGTRMSGFAPAGNGPIEQPHPIVGQKTAARLPAAFREPPREAHVGRIGRSGRRQGAVSAAHRSRELTHGLREPRRRRSTARGVLPVRRHPSAPGSLRDSRGYGALGRPAPTDGRCLGPRHRPWWHLPMPPSRRPTSEQRPHP